MVSQLENEILECVVNSFHDLMDELIFLRRLVYEAETAFMSPITLSEDRQIVKEKLISWKHSYKVVLQALIQSCDQADSRLKNYDNTRYLELKKLTEEARTWLYELSLKPVDSYT